MGVTAYRVTAAATAAVMLIGLVVSVVLGGCDTLIPCESGSVPMKCHWAFVATTIVFAGGALAALAQLLPAIASSRPARLFAALTTFIVAAIAAILPSGLGIGICAWEGMALCPPDQMDCHTTAPIVWACSGLLAIIALIQAVKANPEPKKLPRMDDSIPNDPEE
jgi:hypothetical protein